MMNHQDCSGWDTRPQRRVVFVSSDSEPLLSDAIFTALDDEIIFVENTAQAYSRIKRVAPDLVILCLSDEDVEGCRVLSMLALDSDTSHIPVLTFLTPDCGITEPRTPIEREPDTCCRPALYQ